MKLEQVNKRTQIRTLISESEAPVIAEIGVRYGEFFRHLFAPNVRQIVAVDIWQDTGSYAQNDQNYNQQELDKQYNSFCERYRSYGDRVKVVRDFSTTASQQFEDQYFDFIYIDADHTHDAVLEDLRSWYPKLKTGGVIGGHDYKQRKIVSRITGEESHYGVIRAVDVFLEEIGLDKTKLHVTREKFPSYFFTKL